MWLVEELKGIIVAQNASQRLCTVKPERWDGPDHTGPVAYMRILVFVLKIVVYH